MLFERPSANASPTPRAAFRWHRAAAIGCAVVFVIYAFWAFWLGYTQSRPVDFLSFWAAGRLALNGQAGVAYDMVAHRLMERTASPIGGWLPFPYPPPFLLFVTPFGALGLWTAFALWLVVTSAIYIIGTRKIAPLPYSLAHPAVLVNTWIGQNGFLTTGVFALGLGAFERSAFAAGAIFGLLIIKPQLALLVPIAFIAGREWRAIAGAALTSLLLVLISYVIFGWEAYAGFFHLLPQQARLIASGKLQWNELASVYAAFRLVGVSATISIAAQLTAAIGAAAITWRAWALRLDTRGPTLAAATLLVTPYLLTYDSILLIIPMGWFIQKQRYPVALVVIWVLCLLPIISYSGTYTGPNTIPLAALLCLWLLYRDEKLSVVGESASSASAAAPSAARPGTGGASRPGAAGSHLF
jgi:hypothetical protein